MINEINPSLNQIEQESPQKMTDSKKTLPASPKTLSQTQLLQQLSSPPQLNKNTQKQIVKKNQSPHQRQNLHQQKSQEKGLSQSQSPAVIKPRFSQFGHQNFNSKPSFKKEIQLPKIDQKHYSQSPKVQPAAKAVKSKKITQTINVTKKPDKQIKLKSQEVEKRSVFDNTDGCYKYYVGVGNNEGLVKRIMKRRTWWRETFDSTTMLVNFKWQQNERGYRYDRLISNQNYKQLVNHFEHHREISNKQYLLQNLTNHCEHIKQNVFDYVPLTFILDFADDNCEYFINQFLKAYENYMPAKMKKQFTEGINKFTMEIRRRLRCYIGQGTYNNYRDNTQYTRYRMTDQFVAGDESNYIWLLKPTFLNRGRGIHVFGDLKVLLQIIQEYQEGYIEKSLKKEKKDECDDDKDGIYQTNGEKQELVSQAAKTKQQQKPQSQRSQNQPQVDPNSYIRVIPTGPCIIKAHAFVVQKYIEKPALINNRKFDIRVWALLTHELDSYFFSEGYIRTSSENFDIFDIDNFFIHLTNNAIQKFSDNYGQFEHGNQLSFQQYQEYLNSLEIDVNVKKMVQKMKELIFMTFQSIKKKINFEERKYCFEIFGFDFIVDSAFQVWLIEVNTNPCIEESSPLLAMLIPRMLGFFNYTLQCLDDAFKLTLDVLFPRIKNQPVIKQNVSNQSVTQKLQGKPNELIDFREQISVKNFNSLQTFELPQINEHKEEDPSEWHVTGYPDDENLWQFLGSLKEVKETDKKSIVQKPKK